MFNSLIFHQEEFNVRGFNASVSIHTRICIILYYKIYPNVFIFGGPIACGSIHLIFVKMRLLRLYRILGAMINNVFAKWEINRGTDWKLSCSLTHPHTNADYFLTQFALKENILFFLYRQRLRNIKTF